MLKLADAAAAKKKSNKKKKNANKNKEAAPPGNGDVKVDKDEVDDEPDTPTTAVSLCRDFQVR